MRNIILFVALLGVSNPALAANTNTTFDSAQIKLGDVNVPDFGQEKKLEIIEGAAASTPGVVKATLVARYSLDSYGQCVSDLAMTKEAVTKQSRVEGSSLVPITDIEGYCKEVMGSSSSTSSGSSGGGGVPKCGTFNAHVRRACEGEGVPEEKFLWGSWDEWGGQIGNIPKSPPDEATDKAACLKLCEKEAKRFRDDVGYCMFLPTSVNMENGLGHSGICSWVSDNYCNMQRTARVRNWSADFPGHMDHYWSAECK